MKIIISFALVIILGFSTHAQNSENAKSTLRLDSTIDDLTITSAFLKQLYLPFNKIEVIDARYDTSKLGFTFDRKIRELERGDFKRIMLVNGVAKNIEQFYNTYYKSSLTQSENKLLIVLKKLWISFLPVNRQSQKESDYEDPSAQDIYVKIEYYLHRSAEYYPLLRLDTVYQLKNEISKEEGISPKNNDMAFFSYTIRNVIEKMNFNELIAKASNKKKMLIRDVDSFNRKRFNIPILTTSRYNEGIFKNGKEFINNNPSIKEYKLNKKGKLSSFVDENDHNAICWAFADTNGLHITNAKQIEIFRIGNAFEFFSDEFVMLPRTTGGLFSDVLSFIPSPLSINSKSNPSINQDGTKSITIPRQLDMETGEVY